MNENKEFEHKIDPDLWAEIEEWEKTDHDEPAEYYFSNPDPYLKPQPLPPDHSRHNCSKSEYAASPKKYAFRTDCGRFNVIARVKKGSMQRQTARIFPGKVSFHGETDIFTGVRCCFCSIPFPFQSVSRKRIHTL